MTCFVLQASVSAQGAGRVIAPVFHTASAGERLVAFVQSAPGTSHRAMVSGSGLDWHVVRRERSPQGDVAVWTAVAPKVLDAVAVSSTVPTGDQNLTVIAMEGTEGLGASVAASGSRGRPGVSLTTTRPTSLVFAAGIDAGAATTIPPGWAAISQPVHLASGRTAWIQYTNQPTNDPPQTVTLPQPGDGARRLGRPCGRAARRRGLISRHCMRRPLSVARRHTRLRCGWDRNVVRRTPLTSYRRCDDDSGYCAIGG